jgi:group I intron endonuclease
VTTDRLFIVYRIRNKRNGKLYFGVTAIGLDGRWKKHVQASKTGRKTRIAKAIAKFGADVFTIECVTGGLSKEAAYEKEAALILECRSTDPAVGYNMSTGGENSRLGSRHTLETKRKISARSLGRPSARKGKRHTDESRAKMSVAHLGQPSPHKGKPRPDEVRAKISATQKANPRHYEWGKEQREKLHRTRCGCAIGAHPCKGKYRARICINGVVKYLGSFPTADLASEAYRKAAALISNRFWESEA